jgi:hypothetical protein
MKSSIEKMFLQGDESEKEVKMGHFELIHRDTGEVMLPSYWSWAIKPGWQIDMNMWPEQEEKLKLYNSSESDTESKHVAVSEVLVRRESSQPILRPPPPPGASDLEMGNGSSTKRNCSEPDKASAAKKKIKKPKV